MSVFDNSRVQKLNKINLPYKNTFYNINRWEQFTVPMSQPTETRSTFPVSRWEFPLDRVVGL